LIHQDSISDLAKGCVDRALITLRDYAEEDIGNRWTFHCWSPPDSGLSGRAKLLHSTFLQTLKRKRHETYKQYSDIVNPGNRLVQVWLGAHDKAYISVVPLGFNDAFGWNRPLPWSEGIVPVSEDKRPPSRAYKKADEVRILLT
jgi:hypothetical protein